MRKSPTVHYVPGRSTLAETLAYKNPTLVQHYMHKLRLTRHQADQLFTDVKLFLFIAASHAEPISPSGPVDDGWHEFILSTRDYEDFCRRYLGRFIHHTPISTKDKREVKPAKDVVTSVLGTKRRLSRNWGSEVGARNLHLNYYSPPGSGGGGCETCGTRCAD